MFSRPPFTNANLTQLKENPCWEYILAVFEQELEKGETALAKEGEFNHGKGLGIRDTAKLILRMPEQMEKMLK